jgi:hypothetical protein
MNFAIAIIVAVVAISWIGAVIAYIVESRREQPAKSFQMRDINPRTFQFLGLFGYPTWFPISTIAVVLIAPIYIIEWLVNKQPKQKT